MVLAAQQDRKKFSALYNKYFKEIFLFILKKTADETLAAELSSNTFMKAMVNLTKYRDMGFPFLPGYIELHLTKYINTIVIIIKFKK